MADIYTALDRALDPTTQRPALAADAEIARFRSRWQGEHAVIHSRRTGRYHRLTGAEAALASSLDGSRTVAELAVEGLGGETWHVDEVAGLVGFLHRAGCLAQPWVDTYDLLAQRIAPASSRRLERARRWMRAATVQVPGVERVAGALYGAGGRLLFTAPAVALLSVLCAAGLVAVVAGASEPGHELLGPPSAGAAAVLWLLTLVALSIHELGHALAIRRAGRRILGAGVQLYLGNPAFFIDSTDMVMAGPRARAVNAAAGPFAQAVVASVAALVATVAGDTAVGRLAYRFAALTFLCAAINLVPFLELDGYWLMTDLLDVPDLRPRALAFLRHDLPARIRTREPLAAGEWALLAFGVTAGVATLAALAVAAALWWPILGSFASGLWRSGIPGRALLVLLLLMVVGPLTHGLGGVARAVRRGAGELAASVRFRFERRWRVEAGELFASLPQVTTLAPDALNELAGRVQRRRFAPGETLVRQGEPADAFFLLRRGRCAVVENAPDGDESIIARLGPGASFGELALLEGTPRTATVRAETAGEAFTVDAGAYHRILAARLARPDLAPAQWPLTQVWALPPFRSLDVAAASRLAAEGQWRRVGPGEDVIRQGDVGETFYVVQSGQLEVLRDGAAVATLRAGDHFGEIALLHDVPRTATVRALTPARLFALPRAAFDRVVRASFATPDTIERPRPHTHTGPAPR